MNIESVKQYFSRYSGAKGLDSTGPNFGKTIRKDLSELLGLPIDSFDFRIY